MELDVFKQSFDDLYTLKSGIIEKAKTISTSITALESSFETNESSLSLGARKDVYMLIEEIKKAAKDDAHSQNDLVQFLTHAICIRIGGVSSSITAGWHVDENGGAIE